MLDRPYLARLVGPAARDRLARLMGVAESVSVTERIAGCRDPKDDKFLELAVNGKAGVIVSDDADLLILNSFCCMPIVAPTIFVRGTGRPPGNR